MNTDSKQKVYTVSRGPADEKYTHKYDGVLHRFNFMVEQEIYLTAVRFYGMPAKAKEEAVDYFVYLKVKESMVHADISDKDLQTFFKETKFQKMFKKKEVTTVDFPEPVRIPANTWTEIGYQLDGPETEAVNETGYNKVVLVSDDRSIRFECTRAPRQLKDIVFILP